MKFPARIPSIRSALGLVLILSMLGLGGQSTSAPPPSGTTETNITRIAAGILEQSQFSHRSIDNDLAGDFLDRYLDDLDWSRSLFLQSDLKEFAAYRGTLAQATHGVGDTTPAHAIFGRFLQRLQQKVAYTTHLLRTVKFEFTGHDVYSYDREHARRPRDLREARGLWRQQLRAEFLQEKLADKKPEQIASLLVRRNTQQLATMKALHSDEVLGIYLNSLAHVFDPHSDYLSHEELETLNISMNLSLFGIGASLETEDGYCKIHELTPGGPALRSGLVSPGDRILAVAQANGEAVDITTMPLARAVELIRGPKGSKVKLTILPMGAPVGGHTKIVSLVRDEIKLEDQRAKARILDWRTGHGTTVRLGIIDLPSFYADMDGGRGARSATADVAALLAKLKAEHVRGVVLDLRTNGGGSLEEAIHLTGLFIRRGPVVQTRDFAGDIEVGSDKDPAVQYDGPLVLLTSRFSASASEILAGALQDYGRAVVVGDTSTFGKGTVQTILPLAPVMEKAGIPYAYDPGALKVTISKFYRPDGASTQLRGVASDIVLPSPSDFSDVNESALKHPLPWDAVAPAPHEHLNRVQPYLNTLRERSLRRVKTDKEFAYLSDDIARLKRNMEEKYVSLNEAGRRKEMARIKARADARAREIRAQLAARPTSYEITVKDASLPGLPKPLIATEENAKTQTVKPSSPGAGVGLMTAAPSPDSDVILKEATKILMDYTNLLGGQTKRANPGTSPVL